MALLIKIVKVVFGFHLHETVNCLQKKKTWHKEQDNEQCFRETDYVFIMFYGING